MIDTFEEIWERINEASSLYDQHKHGSIYNYLTEQKPLIDPKLIHTEANGMMCATDRNGQRMYY